MEKQIITCFFIVPSFLRVFFFLVSVIVWSCFLDLCNVLWCMTCYIGMLPKLGVLYSYLGGQILWKLIPFAILLFIWKEGMTKLSTLDRSLWIICWKT